MRHESLVRRKHCQSSRGDRRHMLGLCLLASICCSSQGLIVRGGTAADASPRLPRLITLRLITLRGGVEQSEPTSPKLVNTSSNSTSQPPVQSKRPTRQANTGVTFGVRDGVAAALGLSAAGAVQWCSNKNYCAAMMALVPAHVRKPVWVLLSGSLAAFLFLFVRITNPSRVLCQMPKGLRASSSHAGYP